MAKSKKTYREIDIFSAVASSYLHPCPASPKDEPPPDSKLTYALKKMSERLIPIRQEYQNRARDNAVKNAAVEQEGPAKGAILIGPDRNMRYTPEGQAALDKFEREEYKKTVEIEPYYVKREDLSDYDKGKLFPDPDTADAESLRKIFEGFVLEPTK